jgi:hypothetical protein
MILPNEGQVMTDETRGAGAAVVRMRQDEKTISKLFALSGVRRISVL